MEARVKATGKIVEIVGEGIPNSNMVMAAHGEWFTKDELDIVPLSWKPFEPTYWEKLIHQYAGMAMQGLLNNPALAQLLRDDNITVKEKTRVISEWAKMYATALVEKMKGEK